MLKITVHIDGMACGMCEAHINNAIRNSFKIKKVESSHSQGTTQIITETPIDDNELKKIIEKTGYSVKEISTEPYIKKGFSLFRKK